jgi:rhodanese-related sulfurtransferase
MGQSGIQIMSKKSLQKQTSKLSKPSLLTPAQLRSRQEQLVIIDVRGRLEYWLGHIPGARLWNRMRILQEVPKHQPIAITCLSGHRSAIATQWFVAQGYQKIYNLQGGLMAWQREGNPTKQGFRP